ncbi:MAG TPA: VOC family protein [Bryobacteraceae bacterium]|nr:VOC family protein [Bryobacteraceae bacterium]
MLPAAKVVERVTEVVPFLRVSDMERSVRYYVDGLGFTITNKWVPDGKLRWCWMIKGRAALMLQEFWRDGNPGGRPDGSLGQGVSLVFQCEDALAIYRDVTSRNIAATEPFVGNALWTFSLCDPDGYRLEFASPTDVPEETKLSEVEGQGTS